MQPNPILIVDDERNIRLTLSRALEPLGRPVQAAVNGEEALRMMAAADYDLVLLDLKMPGMDGLEALRLIRERRPKTRVIVITAHGTVDSAVAAMKLGAVDFIQKPFSPVEIRDQVRQVLAREAIEDTPEADYGTLCELAKRHIADQRLEDADRITRRAVALDPERAEAYNLLGALKEIGGEWREAQNFYRAALDLDPTLRAARANLDRLSSWPKAGHIDLGPNQAPAASPALGRSDRGEGKDAK